MATRERQHLRRRAPRRRGLSSRSPITDPMDSTVRDREYVEADPLAPAYDRSTGRDREYVETDPLASSSRRRRPVAPPPAPGGAGGDWRAAVATASGLNVLAGIWLIIAPFVLNYRSGDPIWNDVVFGAIVAILGLIRISGAYRASELSWINAIIGAWIFVSAFWLDASGTAAANDIIFGVVVFVLALASASASESARPWYRR